MMNGEGKMKINLDQFELLYLLESSLKLTRVYIMARFVDEWWKEMNIEIRNFIFHYTIRDIYEKVPRILQPEFDMLIARFNPNNQYVITDNGHKFPEEHCCFKYKNKYWIDSHMTIREDCLKHCDVVKLEDQLDAYNKKYEHLKHELKGFEM